MLSLMLLLINNSKEIKLVFFNFNLFTREEDIQTSISFLSFELKRRNLFAKAFESAIRKMSRMK
jgi:hypothetical protein